jgi:hypothetical protein
VVSEPLIRGLSCLCWPGRARKAPHKPRAEFAEVRSSGCADRGRGAGRFSEQYVALFAFGSLWRVRLRPSREDAPFHLTQSRCSAERRRRMPTSENEALGGSIATRGKAETSTPDRDAVMIWRRPDDGQSVDAANSQKLEAETANSTAVPSAVRPSRAASLLHHIVIVGGGAAGLETGHQAG